MSTATIAAATTIVASPSIAVADASLDIARAGDCPEKPAIEQLARAELMIKTLQTRHVSRDWKFDEIAGERVLRFFRTAVQFPTTHESQPGYEDEWTFVIRFVYDHGQSLDWLILGEIGGLICRAASHSRAAQRANADPILAAIDEHRSAVLAIFQLHHTNHSDDEVFDSQARTAHEKMDEKAVALTNIQPTTMDGIVSLLTYVHEVNTGGVQYLGEEDNSYSEEELWPDTLIDNEIKSPRGRVIELPFGYWVMENIRAALSEIRTAA